MPKCEPVYQEEEDEKENPPPVVQNTRPVNVVQNVNPISSIAQHYQLLQQQYMKQKQEKYNNLCSNMFKTKPKKR